MLNAIDKLFYLLDQFATKKSQWGVRELSAEIGLSPNLTHWYLKNLERHRAVLKDSETGKYQLGHKLFELGNRVPKLTTLKRVSYPILRRISEITKGTAVLRVLADDELLCLATAESPSSLRVHYSEGTRVPCNFGCVGKLLMAYLDHKQAENLLAAGKIHKFTEKTIVERNALRKEWVRIRSRGWAYSNGETIHGARAIAAPVKEASGNVCAGLGLTFPAIFLPSSRVKKVAKEVIKAADEISCQLGWTGMPKIKVKAGTQRAKRSMSH